MFYDITKILTYNALLNILIGERGVGKTYSATKFCVKDFIKKGNEFAYIRRYKSDLKESVPKLFKALNKNDEFPDHELTNKGNTFYCDGVPCGYAMTLSTSQDLKSTNFPNVKTIIFDEFIIEPGQKKYYLQNEVFVFLNLIETIARLRNIRVLMLSNAVSISNPYFLYFDLSLPYNNDIKTFKDGLILVQYMKNEEYRAFKKSTPFGRLVEGTSFGDYSINNKFMSDDNTFLEKKKGTAVFKFAFIYMDQTLGVWEDQKEGLSYISKDYQENTPFLFACTNQDHDVNTMLVKRASKYQCWKTLLKYYELGLLRFEDQKVKNATMEVLKLIVT